MNIGTTHHGLKVWKAYRLKLVNESCLLFGLKINVTETKRMKVGKINIDPVELPLEDEEVTDSRYIGRWLNGAISSVKVIKARIELSRADFWRCSLLQITICL